MEREKRRENIAAGVVGALLGTLLGVVCTVVLGQLGYVASISGLVMAVGALKGYELLAGRLSKKGAVVSSILILGMTYLAHRLSLAISLTSELGMDVLRCFQAIPPLLRTGLLDGPAYWGDLVMLYVFTLLGAVPTIIAGLRSADMPDMPQAVGAVQDPGSVEGAFYPGRLDWMRPLRVCAALSMFVGLVPGIALLLVSAANDTAFAPMFAALGCIIASAVMMCFALPVIQLCNNAMAVMVRSGGTVWKVNLPMLNNADTYRFTKRTGAFRAIRWDILNEEERSRAVTSIQRAIALLSGGQVMPGSALSLAVMPLTDLRVVKETRWAWKCAYAGKDGREKKLTIPKAFPGFAPGPEAEAAQEPVPARWGLLGLAVALAVVLGAAGFGLGLQLDAPAPKAPAHSSICYERAEPQQMRGISLEIRSLYEENTL